MDLNLPEKSVFIGPATLWKRVFAFIIDLFIIDFFVLSIFNTVAKSMMGGAGDIFIAYKMLQQNTSQMQAVTLLSILIITLVFVYFILLQYATGQTVGCMILKIHVVAQAGEKDFKLPGLWQCVLRNLFLIPTIPFILLWVADPLYMLFVKKGQRLTEWLSTTLVVEQHSL